MDWGCVVVVVVVCCRLSAHDTFVDVYLVFISTRIYVEVREIFTLDSLSSKVSACLDKFRIIIGSGKDDVTTNERNLRYGIMALT